jgi:hypothetical protein
MNLNLVLVTFDDWEAFYVNGKMVKEGSYLSLPRVLGMLGTYVDDLLYEEPVKSIAQLTCKVIPIKGPCLDILPANLDLLARRFNLEI